MERVIVKDLKRDFKTHKEKLLQGHRVKRRLNAMQEASKKLVKIYDDEDGSRKEEISALANKENPFSVFYERLRDIKDYHRRFVSADVTEAENDEHLIKEEPQVPFTGEEGMGRYLDLHEHFQAFCNAKFGKKQEYYEYVGSLGSHLTSIPRSAKSTGAYRDYAHSLLEYLSSFYTRTQPLATLQKQMAKTEDAATQQFQAGTLPGWEEQGPVAGVQSMLTDGEGLDLTAFDSAEELETAGAERLKEALQGLGLKCGGTLKQRAERLWLTRTTPLDQLDKKLFAFGLGPSSGADAANNALGIDPAVAAKSKALAVAVMEAKITKLLELLVNVLSDTQGRIEKRQAQTYEELMAEQEEAVDEAGAAGEEASDNEDDFIYNPLKLPLGWDGKPIPYWLYKLHGLNQEFKCEICGNFSYWGRRAYEKHFKEYRHQNGMRALGIPNNKWFFEVTSIGDANALWTDIQAKQKGGFKAETDEEFEDAQGNVYNKRTYMDLKKQGLL